MTHHYIRRNAAHLTLIGIPIYPQLELTINILLRAFKSFIVKYNIVCIFIQTILFQYSCNFSYVNHFTINFLKSIETNQYAFSYKSFQQFKAFRNHSNTLELEREVENKLQNGNKRESRRINQKACCTLITILGISINSGFPPR